MRIDAVVAMGAAATALFSQEITVKYVGVPVNVLVACALGAYASFSFGDKVEPRPYMFKLFTACIIMGAGFTAITEAVIGGGKTEGLLPAIGLVVSCLTRFWVPSIIEVIREKQWVNWIPFLNKRGGP